MTMTLRDHWPTVVAIINAIGTDISKTEALNAIEKELAELLGCPECGDRRVVLEAPGNVLDGRVFWVPCPVCRP
jgi:hypothetical protein